MKIERTCQNVGNIVGGPALHFHRARRRLSLRGWL